MFRIPGALEDGYERATEQGLSNSGIAIALILVPTIAAVGIIGAIDIATRFQLF